MDKIIGFSGEFEFLKTDYPCVVYFDGQSYSSASHAYWFKRSEVCTENDEVTLQRMKKAPSLLLELASEIEETEKWVKMKQ